MPNIGLDRAVKIKQRTLHRWLYADCETYLDHEFFYDRELQGDMWRLDKRREGSRGMVESL
jgi:hypothetical protein